MTLSTQQAGALVKGAPAVAQKLVKLEVTRAFCIQGVRQEIGSVLEVPEGLAIELKAMAKAVAYVEKPAPARSVRPSKEKPE